MGDGYAHHSQGVCLSWGIWLPFDGDPTVWFQILRPTLSAVPGPCARQGQRAELALRFLRLGILFGSSLLKKLEQWISLRFPSLSTNLADQVAPLQWSCLHRPLQWPAWPSLTPLNSLASATAKILLLFDILGLEARTQSACRP